MSGILERAITVVVTLGSGSFSAGDNTITLEGYRVSAAVDFVAQNMVSAQVSIYGLDIATMNKLSSLGNPVYSTNNNEVSILAGDPVSGMSLVFQGTMQDAVPDFTAMPDACFNITAYTGILAALKAVSASSYAGSADVATIMKNMASLAGYSFENNGVNVKLSNPYFPGTALDQIKACARHANINFVIDKNTLAIWPKNGVRGAGIPVIGPTSGLVGYPKYTAYGLDFRSVFNPSFVYGALVQIESSLQPANGKWAIYGLMHVLDSQTPGGNWFSDVTTWYQGNLILEPS